MIMIKDFARSQELYIWLAPESLESSRLRFIPASAVPQQLLVVSSRTLQDRRYKEHFHPGTFVWNEAEKREALDRVSRLSWSLSSWFGVWQNNLYL